MKIRTIVLTGISTILLAATAMAADEAVLKDQKAKESYSLGYQFGRNITAQDVPLDEEVLIKGLRDALGNKNAALGQNEISDTLKDLRGRVFAQQEQRARAQAAKNLEEAKVFLEANKQKPGVITLSSGLQYKVMSEGKGTSPKAADGVKIRYRGTLTNGTEFDNVTDMAESDIPVIPVTGANQGWSEALQLMKPGAKWQLYVPPQLGFGDRAYGRIPANSVLVYELELLSVVDRSVAAGPDQVSAMKGQDPDAQASLQKANN